MTTLTVNGRQLTIPTSRTHLADDLRETLRLTGTHLGCEHGVCGACTILLDGEPARACLTYTALCDGADIRTIEGLEHDPIATRLREAFSLEHALQCGYCTPGMLVTARDIVLRLPDADDDRIRLELAGNLCRCTGYNGIVRAIRRVLDEKLDIRPQPRLAIPTAQFGTQRAATTASAVPTDGLHQRLPFPVSADALWTALHDPALLATCIPGAAIDHVEDGRITGNMLMAIGPIRVRFAGQATVAYDETARTGTVAGGGNDRGTSVTASAAFRVESAGPAAAILHVDIDYALRGALAQLARGRVVDLLAGELGAQFGRNLAARLTGHAPPPSKSLSPARLTLRLLLQWLKRRLTP
jgi:carbon-monoxide dehydrogenase small subunit